MVLAEGVLVSWVQWVDRLPTLPPPRRRGRPKVYPGPAAGEGAGRHDPAAAVHGEHKNRGR